jgi:hypothetical protein
VEVQQGEPVTPLEGCIMLLKTSPSQGVKHALGRDHFLVHGVEHGHDSTWRVDRALGGLCHRDVCVWWGGGGGARV